MEFADWVRLITILASGIAAGVLVTVLTVLTPLIGQLGTAGLHMKNLMDPLIDRVNPPMMVLSIAGGVLTLIVADDMSDAATVLTVIGIVGAVGVVVLSFGFNFRLNAVMAKMPTDDIPPEFPEVFARWIRYHVVRTLSGLLGFAGFAASMAVQLH
jgi:hypothetical protein